MAETIVDAVPGMSCQNCVASVRDEIGAVPGVERIAVDLASKRVEVHGQALDAAAVRAAVGEAGYEARPSGR